MVVDHNSFWRNIYKKVVWCTGREERVIDF